MVANLASSELAEIRRMQPEDLDEVFQIELKAYPYPWTRGIFTDCLQSGFPAWVMQQDGVVCGYSLMSLAAGESHLLNLCIDPDYQGAGLGAYFLDWLLLEVAKQGAQVVFLEVRPSNLAAISLYEQRGFNQIGLRPGYYRTGPKREDALVMALQL
ncbi:MAG: ribosomal protein S18-alanine N-acetyltransferase [Xanthomonadales bacterium]|nr:ribosomal protein S18-alanine N-acetyltransferase [Xanthomonadales bacterium]